MWQQQTKNRPTVGHHSNLCVGTCVLIPRDGRPSWLTRHGSLWKVTSPRTGLNTAYHIPHTPAYPIVTTTYVCPRTPATA